MIKIYAGLCIYIVMHIYLVTARGGQTSIPRRVGDETSWWKLYSWTSHFRLARRDETRRISQNWTRVQLASWASLFYFIFLSVYWHVQVAVQLARDETDRSAGAADQSQAINSTWEFCPIMSLCTTVFNLLLIYNNTHVVMYTHYTR